MKWMVRKPQGASKVATGVELLSGKVNELTKKAALYLGQRTVHFSPRRWKILLGLFCIALAGLSVWVIYDSLKSERSEAFSITSIKFIPLANKTHENVRPYRGTEFSHIHLFKIYLDSLSQTPSGQKIRDSFLNARPHLLDSVNCLEQLYQQYSKNESYEK